MYASYMQSGCVFFFVINFGGCPTWLLQNNMVGLLGDASAPHKHNFTV